MLPKPTLPSALAYNLYLKSDLVRVATAFEVRQIPWLLIKGISLADALYGGIAHRSMVDNDIVVRQGDVGRAHEELRRLGFVDREANVLALNLRADFQHPMHWDHCSVQTGLELHWHVHPPELFESELEGYFRRAVSMYSGDLRYRTLCADDRLIHLATHWAQHGLNKSSILEDLQRAWNAQPELGARDSNTLDLGVVARRSKAMGAFDVLCVALLVLEGSGRLKVGVPTFLRSARATWFVNLHRGTLKQAAEREIDGVKAHHLRLASWSLLRTRSVWRCASRELMPSRERLSRIVGKELSRTEALRVLWIRQRRAASKWLGYEGVDAGQRRF